MGKGTKIALGILCVLSIIGSAVGITLLATRNNDDDNGNGGNGNDNNGNGNNNNSNTEEKESSIGKIAYSDTGVKLRMSAKVDDGWKDNRLTDEEVTGDLGVVVSEVKGEEDGLTWYYIKLYEPIWDYLPYPTKETHAYARQVDKSGNVIVKLKKQ